MVAPRYLSRAIVTCLAAVSSKEVADPLPSSCLGEAGVQGASGTGRHADDASFLQVDSFERVTAEPSQSAAVIRASALKPVAWMHVQKAGTTFLNTLIHNPTLCPYMPEDLYVEVANHTDPLYDPLHAFFIEHFDADSRDTYCPGAWSKTYDVMMHHHAPIAPSYAENVGHFVTTLRQPEQRTMSAYYYAIDVLGVDHVPPLPEWALTRRGHVVKMLTEEMDLTFWYPLRQFDAEAPSEEQTALAVQRLREGFAFVGLTEEWSLSTCLFHAMFGGICASEEFQDVRLGTNRTNHEPYDTSLLEGVADVHDGKVYAEGVRIFESNLKQYGVHASNCPALCKSK